MAKPERQWCTSCEMAVEVDYDNPVYDCPNGCGEFTRNYSYDGASHCCPQCVKFSSKVADGTCPDCEGYDFEDVNECSDCGEEYGSDHDECTAKEVTCERCEETYQDGDDHYCGVTDEEDDG